MVLLQPPQLRQRSSGSVSAFSQRGAGLAPAPAYMAACGPRRCERAPPARGSGRGQVEGGALAGPGQRRPGGTRRSGPRPKVEVRPGRPWSGGPAPRAAGRRAGPDEVRGRGRGRLVRVRPARPVLPGLRVTFGAPPTVTFKLEHKGSRLPQDVHLPLRSDSSPGTAGDAPRRGSLARGTVSNGSSNSYGVCIARLSSLVNALVFSHTEGRRCLQTWGRRDTV